ncbi:MAG TPA: hypothetical protein VJG32_06960 [Anaerolineae bacterium]|nr:hypothetical protein [Anaerolineae bacterium]
MFAIRYTFVRPILAVFALAFLAAGVFLAQNVAAVAALLALNLATALSWINPPGVFGWLLQGACPVCDGPIVWEVQQEPQPYDERIVVHCKNCDWRKVEFAYQPN